MSRLKQISRINRPKKVPVDSKMEEVELGYNPIGSYRNGNPYTMAFIYPRNDSPYLVKGGARDVDKYIKKRQSKNPAIAHQTYWKDGKVRGKYQEIIGGRFHPNYRSIFFSHHEDKEIGHHFKIVVMNSRTSSGATYVKNIKRIPRKWIKELNDYYM